MQRERGGGGEAQRETGAGLVGERGFLAQRQSQVGDLEPGGDEQVEKQAVRGVRVDEPAVASRVLHATADAAPETLLGLRIDAVMRGPDGGEVDVAGNRRVDRRQEVVEERAFVVIGLGGPGSAAKSSSVRRSMLKVLQVSGPSRLPTRVAKFVGALKCSETLLPPKATLRRPVTFSQKKRAAETASASPSRAPSRARPTIFGIWVLACRPVSRSSCREQGIDYGAVAEAARGGEIPFLGGQGIEVGQDFAHAAVLGDEHRLQPFVGKAGDQSHAPIAVADEQGASPRLAGDENGVAEAGKGLVEVVPLGPTCR